MLMLPKWNYTSTFYILAMTLVFFSCSSFDESANDKTHRRNCKGEYLYRKHDDHLYSITTPVHSPRDPYPWEGQLSSITKEYFRCKGSAMSPPVFDEKEPRTDCEGSARHGLPVIHGKPGVYPILIELLNYVQKSTGKRVIITSGHRCPIHNKYVDSSKDNLYSKHQMGAEVDFYVQDMESRPLEIVSLLIKFYKETPRYQEKKEYIEFQRYEKGDAHVAAKPWLNREIYIKAHAPTEGRNGDNHHSYPYITIQVRYDRDTQEKVVYDWQKANLGFVRG